MFEPEPLSLAELGLRVLTASRPRLAESIVVRVEPWPQVCRGGRARLEELLESVPGPEVVAALAEFDLPSLPAEAAVTWLQVHQRCQAWFDALAASGLVAAAGALERVDEFYIGGDPESDGFDSVRAIRIHDSAISEVAAALRWSPRTAAARVHAARDLVGPYAPAHDALWSGSITSNHVNAIRHEVDRLPYSGVEQRAEQCRIVLASVLPYATTHTPGQTRLRTRGYAAHITEIDAAGRRERARREFGITVMDDVDSVSVLSATMATPAAHAILSAINALTEDARFVTGCDDTIGQRRVDALTTLVLDNSGHLPFDPEASAAVETARVTAHIDVVVSLETVLGVSTQPGVIAGAGPIAAGAVLDMLADCSATSTLRRLVSDPVRDGALLDAGRSRYAISDAQRHFVSVRDQTCRFPGCTRRATSCQIDHAQAWNDGGPTNLANLGPLCVKHHQLKTHAGWDILSAEPDGSCIWQTPQLRRYRRDRTDLLPPPVPPPDDDPPF